MKHFYLYVLSLTFCSLLQAAPIVINAPVKHVFVPSGFDNNDNVEVIVTGSFPTTCYSRNKVEVAVRDEVIKVTVTSLNSTKDNSNCESLEIPFMENVTIGNLQAGDYQIVVNNILKEKMTVNVSSSNSVDDHLYAMINYVELGFMGGLTDEAVLVGKNLNDCLVLDKVEYLSNGKDTLSVLPIMKKVTANCSGERSYLEVPIKFKPKAFANNKVLIFVRTMDGKSISSLIDKK